MFKENKTYTGYTLIEMMLVISLFVMIAAVSMPAFHNIQASVGLEGSAQEVLDVLRQAQQRSFSSRDLMPHGVHFTADAYIIFGNDYSSPAYTRTYFLPAGLEFSAWAGTTILFERHSGIANPATVKLSAGSQEVDIRINANGSIELL